MNNKRTVIGHLKRKRRKKDATRRRHKNKYSAKARAQHREWSGCTSKFRYETKEEAESGIPRTQYAYACGYCEGWHRATKKD